MRSSIRITRHALALSALLAAVLAPLPPAARAQAIAPLGDALRINSYTVGPVPFPAVAAAPDGSFVVVWADRGASPEDPARERVRGRLFLSDGTPAGPDAEVAPTDALVLQGAPDVAASSAGFLVSWRSVDADGRFVEGQVFGADGSPSGAAFEIRSLGPGDPESATAVTVAAREGAQDFLLAWATSDDTIPDAIMLTRIDLDGAIVDGPTPVSDGPPGDLGGATIAVRTDDSFLVGWSRIIAPIGRIGEIYGRAYGSDGLPGLDPFFVMGGDDEDFVVGGALEPRPAGDFLLVYYGDRPTDARAIGIDGAQGSADIAVRDPAATTSAAVAAVGAEGLALVAWSEPVERGTAGFLGSVQGRIVSASTVPIGEAVRLDDASSDTAGRPAVAAQPDGAFVVAWTTGSPNPAIQAGRGVHARRFLGPVGIFTDGFESGDTSEWSSAVGVP